MNDDFLRIEQAAHAGAFGQNPLPEPTPAQCQAGNYKVGRLRLYDLPIAIEQPRGSYRTGIDGKTGKRWASRMAAHYGYINGTRGNDGDCVDCFIGHYPQSAQAFVINQVLGGRFDEHKAMLAFPDEDTARRAYQDSYERDWRGLASIVPLSISQLKWWLKAGDMSRPLRATDLPAEGLETMSRKVQWNSDALPYDTTLDGVLYAIRCADTGEGLLLDAVQLCDILDDADGLLAFDALVTPFARLERKMEVLRGVMERTGGAIKPVAMQITEPFTQRGAANVAVLFELSDGQTVSIFFHNPDTTPSKMAPDDEVISWKWLLNKKDITIVVAPERGADLNVREVARRIMRLAEKNSPAFQRANAKRAERMQNLQALKDEIAGLEQELTRAQHELEVAKVEAEDRAKAKGADQQRAWQQPENAETDPAGGAAVIEAWDSDKADALMGALRNVEDPPPPDNSIRKFISRYLQGRIVKTRLGDCVFNATSRSELAVAANRKGSLKVRVIPRVPVVLLGGDTDGKLEPISADKSKTAAGHGIDGFYTFRDTLGIDEIRVMVEVKVGHRSNETIPLVYSLGEPGKVLDGVKNEGSTLATRKAGISAAAATGSNGANNLIVDTSDGDVKDDDDGLNIRILHVWDKDGNELDPDTMESLTQSTVTNEQPLIDAYFKAGGEDAAQINTAPDAQVGTVDADKIAAVDAAYTFESATDTFKLWLHESLDKPDYSPFVTAKAIDEAAKRHGATVEWGRFSDGAALDGAGSVATLEADAEISEADIGATFDVEEVALDGAHARAMAMDGVDPAGFVGKIKLSGELIGRVDIGDDGKAMIYVGPAGEQRVTRDGGGEALYTDDAAPLVDTLFAMRSLAATGERSADAPPPAAPGTEPDTAALPAEPSQDTSQKAADRTLFQSVIDGTVDDMLAPELADQLEAAYNRHSNDQEMLGLFEQAVNAYQDAMLTATAGLV